MKNDIQSQLERYCQALLQEAEEKRAAFLEKLDQTKATEIEKAETEVLEETYHTIQRHIEKIRSEAAKKVSQLEYETRLELLKYREVLVNQIFDQIQQRLHDFVESPEYQSFLMEVSKKSAAIFSAPCEIMLREADMGYADRLLPLFAPGSKVLPTTKIQIGGLLVQSQERIIDQTLDRRFSDEKKDFAEKSGLTVQ